MPTVSYSESVLSRHAELVAEWEALPDDDRQRIPKPEPRVIPDLDGINVNYPDEWLMEHIDRFHAGRDDAPRGSTEATRIIFGTLALVDSFEGSEVQIGNLQKFGKWPMHYRHFFNWLVDEVYGSYLDAVTIPNGS